MYEQLKVLLHAARYRQIVWEQHYAETGRGSLVATRVKEQVEAIERAMMIEANLMSKPFPED